MEASDGRRPRTARRSRELRGRPAHAADQSILDGLRPAHRQPRLQSRRHVVTSERPNTGSAPTAAHDATHVHTGTSAASQPHAVGCIAPGFLRRNSEVDVSLAVHVDEPMKL